MAEILLSPLVSLLMENLATLGLSLIDLGGIDRKLKKWSNMLGSIQEVLEDAEDKQLNEKRIQQWLKDFQKLAYDIEDVVDDLATEVGRRRQMMAESSRSGKWRRKFVDRFSFKSVSFSYDMNRKIGEISNSLKELDDQKNIMELKKLVGGKSEKPQDLRHPQGSVMDTRVYGRDEDISTILALLLEDRVNDHDGSHFRVISIVGMGGIGKTTMAQSLYNNGKVEHFFPERAWVSVLKDFDVLKVSKMIYEQVYKTSCGFTDLDMVQVKLREKLSKNKFLLVLDDVWDQDYEKWDRLSAPFHAGPPGSTIIVTTRDDRIAKTMGSNYSNELRELKELSDGDCLSLLAQHALQRPNFDGNPEFKEVGEVIAKRCKGLPLAAKSLGGLLRNKGSPDQWVEVSTSNIWELPSNGIIPALRLSYHHLPPDLRPLFVYCSLFPKGYEFDKQELIMLWMAQGFLKQSSGEQKQMEELGFKYFGELLSRSFFQLSSGNKSRYLMHDLNNDLAQFVAGLTYLRLDDKIVSNEQHNIFEEARHASFISHDYADYNKFRALNAAPCLRTLLPIREKSSHGSYLSSLVLKDFPRLLCLRALSFNGYHISEVPKLIGHLNHLRYLDFSNTDITELPDSVCGLYNLQTLLLHGCNDLVQLPSSTQKLINLRHLDISNTQSLKETPKCIGMLSCLRTMPKFIIDTSDGHGISELKGLHHLQGKLSIYGIQNVLNVHDAVEANLLRKEGLSQLVMNWGRKFDDTRGKGIDFEVLDALKPSTRLESLEIEFYGGQKFPSWVGDHSFCNMMKVTLGGCKSCTYLPPLGQLTSLKELFIEGMDGVKIVGPEFIGAGFRHPYAFQSLEVLSFIDLVGWEEWSVIFSNGDGNFKGAFPCLRHLKLCRCMKLNQVSLAKIPSLESLEINGCSEKILRSMVEVGPVKKLKIGYISGGLSKLDEGIIGCLGEVEDLSVSRCKQLRYLWEEEVACKVLEKLKSLEVTYCEQIEYLGDKEQLLPHNLESLVLRFCNKLEKMPNWKNNLMSLRRLSITCCNKLKDDLGSTTYLEPKTENQGQSSSSSRRHGECEFSNLELVSIYGCPSLKCLPTGKQLPSGLRDLCVAYCENMELAEEGENGMSLSLLEFVYSNIKLLPRGLAHLTQLYIRGCSGIELIPETSLPPTLITLIIEDCSNLKYMLCANEMQSLTSLGHLTIAGCNNLEGYPRGGLWPPNLETLEMGEVKQPITEWGLATLPISLLTLEFVGEFPKVVSFSEVGTQLPSTLTRLEIRSLKNLESLGEGLQNLSSLQHLRVILCPKLHKLPKTLLPNLSRLYIFECPLLEERCKKEKRDYWPKISHIPCLEIDHKLMWGL